MTKITKTPSPTMFSAEHCIHFTETETEIYAKTLNKKTLPFLLIAKPNNRTKSNWKTKRKITVMHNIKVRKETTKAESHTFKSSFAFKLENETNENDTTTTKQRHKQERNKMQTRAKQGKITKKRKKKDRIG